MTCQLGMRGLSSHSTCAVYTAHSRAGDCTQQMHLHAVVQSVLYPSYHILVSSHCEVKPAQLRQ